MSLPHAYKVLMWIGVTLGDMNLGSFLRGAFVDYEPWCILNGPIALLNFWIANDMARRSRDLERHDG